MLGMVVSGGDFDPPRRLAAWAGRAALVVAADGGAEHALRMGLPVHLVVGDMDSLSPDVRARLAAAGTEFRTHHPDKNETDTELALREVMERGCDQVVVLCALGGRLDHALANLFLLALPGLEERTLVASGDTEVRLVRKRSRFRGAAGDLLSLLPLGADALGVSTDGLAYPLSNEKLPSGYARGVSNVFTGEQAQVSLQRGLLLAIHIRGVAPATEEE